MSFFLCLRIDDKSLVKASFYSVVYLPPNIVTERHTFILDLEKPLMS